MAGTVSDISQKWFRRPIRQTARQNNTPGNEESDEKEDALEPSNSMSSLG